MRTIFFGSSDFSSNILYSLYQKGVEFALVVTKTQKKKGRGKKESPTPVGVIARELSLNLKETDNPNTEDMERAIREIGVEVFLLASYGRILKENILSAVTYPLNIHPSLLPKYRGITPIRSAIMNGEEKTGVTIFLMDKGIDTGNIVSKKEVIIGIDEVATELEARLSNVAVDLALTILKEIEAGKALQRIPQDEDGAVYAPRIRKEELRINWEESAINVAGKIRGLAYIPGAYTHFRGKRLKILRARSREEVVEGTIPGEVIGVDDVIVVACNPGSVLINELQLSGRGMMNAMSFINGYHIKPGDKLN